ncbi:MAG: 6-phosphofructokinase [Caldisericaceae bacterium]
MKIGVLTGGGDCPGLNPAIRGIVFKASSLGDEVIGFEEGWKGIIEGKSRELSIDDVDDIIDEGGTILFTSRTNPFKIEGGDAKIVETFTKFGLDALVAIGGDDTLGVALKVHKLLKLPVVGVPKTMDNDLSGTDSTFGFNTSVEVSVDALSRLRDTAKSHKRIIVLEVMGREAGWVALYTGIAGGADWILIPEEKPDFEKMYSHLRNAYEKKGYALVVVSEGIDIGDGESTEIDQFGHALLQRKGVCQFVADLIEKNTGVSVRSAVIGHIQRGGPPTVFDRILATRTGVKAVEMIHNGEFGKMAALSGENIISIPLEDACGHLKTVSNEWIELAEVLRR